MDDKLAAFLGLLRPGAAEDVVWGDYMRLRVEAYLTAEQPPLHLVTSARAVVIRDGAVLVMRDRDGTRHILPGGRLEADELPDAALRREVLEESGWTLASIAQIGFLHFRHLDPMPTGYRYPYPSFLQVIHAATARDHAPGRVIEDDWVIGSELLSIAEVRQLPLAARERLFLAAALAS